MTTANDRRRDGELSEVELPTPLERQRYQRLSSSAEMAEYLATLAERAVGAEVLRLGRSVGGRGLLALHLQALSAGATPAARPLRVLLVGSQHGASEAAGGEALLIVARALVGGDLRHLREGIELLLIPNANPDGRDLDSSKNGDDVNINRDFVLLSQPETQALNRALLEFAPDVVLDAHESAILKRKTLARQGYMTDFETQFDFGNNLAIPQALRTFSETVLVPELIAATVAQGLRAHRYIREITSISQPLTHGGLTVRKLRNKAAIAGALCILLETRLDPKDDDYPTFRNIGVRSAKQVRCIRTFLHCVHARARQIRELVERHAASTEALTLDAEYALSTAHPRLQLPLRDIRSRRLQNIEFADHRTLIPGPSMALPANYWIVEHVPAFARLLARHGIACTVLAAPERAQVVVQHYTGDAAAGGLLLHGETVVERTLPAGTLAVAVRPPHARLLPLLLDARSGSSVLRYPAYGDLVSRDGESFILRSM